MQWTVFVVEMLVVKNVTEGAQILLYILRTSEALSPRKQMTKQKVFHLASFDRQNLKQNILGTNYSCDPKSLLFQELVCNRYQR